MLLDKSLLLEHAEYLVDAKNLDIHAKKTVDVRVDTKDMHVDNHILKSSNFYSFPRGFYNSKPVTKYRKKLMQS